MDRPYDALCEPSCSTKHDQSSSAVTPGDIFYMAATGNVKEILCLTDDEILTNLTLEHCQDGCMLGCSMEDLTDTSMTVLDDISVHLNSDEKSTGCITCITNTTAKTETYSISILHILVAFGHLDMVRLVLGRGCDIKKKSGFHGLSVLHYVGRCCSLETQVEMLDVLLDAGADVNSRHTLASDSPLLYFCKQPCVCTDIVLSLVTTPGCDVNACNVSGHTAALNLATSSNNVDLIKLLVDAGADCCIPDSDGWFPLARALFRDNYAIMQCIVERGRNCDLNTPCKLIDRSSTPSTICNYRYLDWALEIDAPTHVVQLLLSHGADPSHVTGNAEFDISPLMVVAQEGSMEIFEAMLEKCTATAVNIGNKNGYTPLHFGAWEGNSDKVRALLAAGAIPDNRTVDGNTPLALACHSNNDEVIRLMLDLGTCNVNNADHDCDTPIIYVCYHDNLLATQLLVGAGASADCCNNLNSTPLWYSVYNKNEELFWFLVTLNVRIDLTSVGVVQDSSTPNETIYETPHRPFEVACDRGFTSAIKHLLLVGAITSSLYKKQYTPAMLRTPNLIKWVVNYLSAPPTLMRQCRNYLRRKLGRSLPDVITTFGIPVTLIDFVLLKKL